MSIIDWKDFYINYSPEEWKAAAHSFFWDLDLFQAHEQTILTCNEYYLCDPGFSGTGPNGTGQDFARAASAGVA